MSDAMRRVSHARFEDAYELEDLIATGGLGTVHACRRSRGDGSSTPLVVKTVRLTDARARDRVVAEILALRRLESARTRGPPNTASSSFPSLRDCFFHAEAVGKRADKKPNLAYARLVMTRPSRFSRDLASLLRTSPTRRLPESQARHYIAQIASALHYLHAAVGTAHGDVKPENALLDERADRVTLCDFDLSSRLAGAPTDDDPPNSGDSKVSNLSNLSKLSKDALDALLSLRFESIDASLEDSLEPSSSREGTRVLGTPEYVAPETVRGARTRADSKTDWYQSGIFLHELVFGTTPFASRFGVVSMTLRNVLRKEVTFPGRPVANDEDDARREEPDPTRATVSRACESFIRALLDRDPNTRLAGFNAVKKHVFFASADETYWETLREAPTPRDETWIGRERMGGVRGSATVRETARATEGATEGETVRETEGEGECCMYE